MNLAVGQHSVVEHLKQWQTDPRTRSLAHLAVSSHRLGCKDGRQGNRLLVCRGRPVVVEFLLPGRPHGLGRAPGCGSCKSVLVSNYTTLAFRPQIDSFYVDVVLAHLLHPECVTDKRALTASPPFRSKWRICVAQVRSIGKINLLLAVSKNVKPCRLPKIV
jgi:hypothetical protein